MSFCLKKHVFLPKNNMSFCQLHIVYKTKIPSFTEGWGNKKTTKTKKERKGFSRDPCANIFNK